VERREIHFSGRVQGVGFRYTARTLADSYDVTGYVRNLSGGRVQLVIEGEARELDRFLKAVQQEMQGNISDTQVDTQPASGEFDDFRIAH